MIELTALTIDILLLPGNVTFIGLATFLLMATGCRFATLRAINLALFVMIFNSFLKGIWQMPLPDTIASHSWAFPSGHMHFAAAFWISIAYTSQKRWPIYCVIMFLFGLGFALLHQGYHHFVDLPAAAILGAIEAILFSYIFTSARSSILPSISLIPICALCIAFDPKNYVYLHYCFGGICIMPFIFHRLANIEKSISSYTFDLAFCGALFLVSAIETFHLTTYEHNRFTAFILAAFIGLTTSYLLTINTTIPKASR